MTSINGTDNKRYIYRPIDSSDRWLEIKLSGTILGVLGSVITLDPKFLACVTIDGSYPLHVVATPTSAPGTSAFWVEKGTSTVTIHGSIGVTYDVIISAKVLGKEDVSYQTDIDFAYSGDLYMDLSNSSESERVTS